MKKLNLGCYDNPLQGYINVDKKKYFKHIDKVVDLDRFPYPFKNNEFDEVVMHHVLEHLKEPIKVLEEVYRISKDKTIIKITVPYKTEEYCNMTHTKGFDDRCFGLGHMDGGRFTGNIKYISNKVRYDIIKMDYIPTSVGRMIPQIRLPFMKSNMRAFVSYFLSNIVKQLYVELKVIKVERWRQR